METTKKILFILAISCTVANLSFANECSSEKETIVDEVKISIKEVSSIVKNNRCLGESDKDVFQMITSSGTQKINIEHCINSNERYIDLSKTNDVVCAFPQFHENHRSSPAFIYKFVNLNGERKLVLDDKYCSHTNKVGSLKLKDSRAVLVVEAKDVLSYISCLEEMKVPYGDRKSQVKCEEFRQNVNFSQYIFE